MILDKPLRKGRHNNKSTPLTIMAVYDDLAVFLFVRGVVGIGGSYV